MSDDNESVSEAIRDLIRIQREIAKRRKERQESMTENSTAAFMFQMTTFAILTSAFSFVGAFVIRDFFKNSIEGVTKRFKLPGAVSNIVYIVLVLGIVIPLLMLISLQKSRAEEREARRVENFRRKMLLESQKGNDTSAFER